MLNADGSFEGRSVPGDDAGVHQPSVDALGMWYPGVFDGTGCEQGLCASDPLQRWEMAVWLVRVLDEADPSPRSESGFADVDPGLWWAPYTARSAELGVTAGCGTGPLRFCPYGPVTRGQMASFLVRAFALKPGTSQGFVDTVGNTHDVNIDTLFAAGITAGCAIEPLRFCPHDSMTRGQMVTFLARATGFGCLAGNPAGCPPRSGVHCCFDWPCPLVRYPG